MHDTCEELTMIGELLRNRWLAATVVAVLTLVTFAVPAWCLASGTWSW